MTLPTSGPRAQEAPADAPPVVEETALSEALKAQVLAVFDKGPLDPKTCTRLAKMFDGARVVLISEKKTRAGDLLGRRRRRRMGGFVSNLGAWDDDDDDDMAEGPMAALASVNNGEQYGAAWIREFLDAFKMSQSSPDKMILAIATAKEKGLDELAAQLEQRLVAQLGGTSAMAPPASPTPEVAGEPDAPPSGVRPARRTAAEASAAATAPDAFPFDNRLLFPLHCDARILVISEEKGTPTQELPPSATEGDLRKAAGSDTGPFTLKAVNEEGIVEMTRTINHPGCQEQFPNDSRPLFANSFDPGVKVEVYRQGNPVTTLLQMPFTQGSLRRAIAKDDLRGALDDGIPFTCRAVSNSDPDLETVRIWFPGSILVRIETVPHPPSAHAPPSEGAPTPEAG